MTFEERVDESEEREQMVSVCVNGVLSEMH